jgi:hypothetical protein
VPGVFTYTPAAGTLQNPGAGETLAVTFTPFDTTHYTSATADSFINVNPPLPTPPHITGIVSVTRTKKGLTAITVGFDEALDSHSAGTRTFYTVFGAVMSSARGKTFDFVYVCRLSYCPRR